MRALRLWWRRGLGAFSGRKAEDALADELQTHIDMFAVRESVAQWGTGPQGIILNPLHAREWGRQCPFIEQIAIARTRGFHFAGADGSGFRSAERPRSRYRWCCRNPS
jgi:hypothetical protein